MELKEEIKNILNRLKSIGISRRDLEKEFGYSRNYIDQALSRGGTDVLFTTLNLYLKKMEAESAVKELSESSPDYLTPKEQIVMLRHIVEEQKRKIEKLESELYRVKAREYRR